MLNDSVSRWEHVLGKYDRVVKYPIGNHYIWDNLGISVSTRKDGHKEGDSEVVVRQLYIHYLGLDSDEAKQGIFENAREYNFKGFKDSLEVLKNSYDIYKNKKSEKEIIENANKFWFRIKEKRNPEKYPYPIKSFKKSFFLNKMNIDPNIHLREFNNNRFKKGNGKFRYVDNTSFYHGSNKSGDNENIHNTYYYIAYPKKVSRAMPLRYNLKYVNQKMSYIKIELLSERDYKRFVE